MSAPARTASASDPPRDRIRIRRGDKISWAGAVLLVGSLLLPWYSVRVAAPDTAGVERERTGISVFTALDGLDVLITCIAVGLVLLFAAIAVGVIDPRLRIAALAGGAAALVIVLLRLVRAPEAVGISVTPSVGILLALAGAVVVIVGQVVGGGRAPSRRRAVGST